MKAKAARVYAAFLADATRTIEELLEPMHEKLVRARAAKVVLRAAGALPPERTTAQASQLVDDFLAHLDAKREGPAEAEPSPSL